MGYCVGSGNNLLWVIVWGVVVMCYGLLCGEWCILLWVIVWGVVVICYGLSCGEWWYYVMGYSVVSGGILLWVIVW